MSVFSKLKGSRKAEAEPKPTTTTAKPVKERYRHIPTHAARDALTATPAKWKLQDERRRQSVSGPISRTPSSLSAVLHAESSSRSAVPRSTPASIYTRTTSWDGRGESSHGARSADVPYPRYKVSRGSSYYGPYNNAAADYTLDPHPLATSVSSSDVSSLTTTPPTSADISAETSATDSDSSSEKSTSLELKSVTKKKLTFDPVIRPSVDSAVTIKAPVVTVAAAAAATEEKARKRESKWLGKLKMAKVKA